MACLYACLCKDPRRNKKSLANRKPSSFPPPSPDSLAVEVSLLEWWDWLKQLGLYHRPYRHRHTGAAPKANSFGSRDNETVAVGPRATGKNWYWIASNKTMALVWSASRCHPFIGCRNFYHPWRILKTVPPPPSKKKEFGVGTRVNHFCKASLGLYDGIIRAVLKKKKFENILQYYSSNCTQKVQHVQL